MPADKSLFYYGKLYNKLLDPLIKPSRAAIIDRIPFGSSVLDIGCGTGLLCLELKRQKDCKVTGIDLSRRMLEHARSINPFADVEFLHQDATNMVDLNEKRFDYILILNVIHELWPDDQLKMLQEAFRIGHRIIIFDSNVPLPWNVSGVIKRLIEITFGFDHYPQFRAYLKSGGIMGILAQSRNKSELIERSSFSQGSNQLFLVSK